MAIVLENGQNAVNTTFTTKSSLTVTGGPDWATPLSWSGEGGDPWHPILWRNLGYGDLYAHQLWVNTVIDKLVRLAVAPDIKVYRDRPRGRELANNSDYGRLVRHPNARHDPVSWWTWMFTTYFIYGFCAAHKQRDPATGRPVQMHGLHPTRLRYGAAWGGYEQGWDEIGLTGDPSENRWWWRRNDGTEFPLRREDLFIVHTYHPSSMEAGLSKLEPLRDTLENEAAARIANKAMWHNGGKPSFVLKHPGKFGNSPTSVQRLADQFARKHGGVGNWGRPLVLEEGMDAVPLKVENDLQYVETRRLNTQEVVSAFDIPPVAVGILERATNNNVVELHRSLYRDTMPPVFKAFQSALDHDVRDGSFGSGRRPDFPPTLTALWSLDEFLRATPEEKIKSDAQAIQTGQKTIAEVRASNNDPFVDGTDVLLVNAAITPLDRALGVDDRAVDPRLIADLAAKLYSATEGNVVFTAEESRALIRMAGFSSLDGDGPVVPARVGPVAGAPPVGSGIRPDGSLPDQPGLATPPNPDPRARPSQAPSTRALWGLLGRVGSLDEIDMAELAFLTPPEYRAKAVGAYILVRDDGGSVAEYRAILKKLGV